MDLVMDSRNLQSRYHYYWLVGRWNFCLDNYYYYNSMLCLFTFPVLRHLELFLFHHFHLALDKAACLHCSFYCYFFWWEDESDLKNFALDCLSGINYSFQISNPTILSSDFPSLSSVWLVVSGLPAPSQMHNYWDYYCCCSDWNYFEFVVVAFHLLKQGLLYFRLNL